MPYYRGGEEALKQFITQHLKYPEEALAQKIEGEVSATYDVDGLGRTRNVKIITSLGYGCNEEVIRLIGLLKYEKAYNKGRNVTLHRKLKVEFKLPERSKSAHQPVKYSIVKKQTSATTESPKKEKTITYTIKF